MDRLTVIPRKKDFEERGAMAQKSVDDHSAAGNTGYHVLTAQASKLGILAEELKGSAPTSQMGSLREGVHGPPKAKMEGCASGAGPCHSGSHRTTAMKLKIRS